MTSRGTDRLPMIGPTGAVSWILQVSVRLEDTSGLTKLLELLNIIEEAGDTKTHGVRKTVRMLNNVAETVDTVY